MKKHTTTPQQDSGRTKVTIRLKDERNGYAIYDKNGVEEIALGFESFQHACHHATVQRWEVILKPEPAKEVLQYKHTQGENKLVRWTNAKFPPIDLNENIKEVIALVGENKRLAERVKYLEDLIKEYTDKMLTNLNNQ